MFDLPEDDVECLLASGHEWESIVDGGTKWIILPQYRVREGYNHEVVSLALRIQPSYPDDQIDMAYFSPALCLKNEKTIGALSLTSIDGKEYQQWSRHRTAHNPWRPGVDNICTHLLQIDTWLARETMK